MAKLDSASNARGTAKSPNALRTISEAADLLDVPQHVLRFWETKFSQIKPLKRNGGRRYYRPEDIDVLLQIKHLLYKQGYTIKGAKKAFENKTVPALKESFTDVGLGAPSAQDNDNAAPQAALPLEEATQEASVEAPVASTQQMQDVSANLKKISASLRAKN